MATLQLTHVQVIINCLSFDAQLYTREDSLAHKIGAPYFDDIISHNLLTTQQVSRKVNEYLIKSTGISERRDE